MDLVGPAGVVAQAVDGQRQIGGFRFADRLAVVERFERGQLVGFVFDQVGQFGDQAAAIAGVHFRPGTVLECVAGGFHRQVDVGRIALGHLGDDFFGRWVDGVKRLAAGGRHPLAADEALRLTDLWSVGCLGDRGHGSLPDRVELRMVRQIQWDESRRGQPTWAAPVRYDFKALADTPTSRATRHLCPRNVVRCSQGRSDAYSSPPSAAAAVFSDDESVAFFRSTGPSCCSSKRPSSAPRAFVLSTLPSLSTSITVGIPMTP